MNYPSATYRIQLNSEFTFKKLADIMDYLHDLGISTIYAAPVTTSEKNSTHGYDVTDPLHINPQIGTLEELKTLSTRLKAYGMTWLQDIVPNHMAFSTDNLRLMDVLERGSDSPYYTYFDIDWNHKKAKGKIWIPVLGSDWQACLMSGEINIGFDHEGFKLHYYDRAFPLAVSAVKYLIGVIREKNLYPGLSFVIEDLIKGTERKDLANWLKHKEKYTSEIRQQFSEELQQVLQWINSDRNKLAEIAAQQPYVLTYWETSEWQMNYRRFFTINNLICLRMEDKNVFEDYHSFFHALYKEKLIQGIRIDHIDGLYDPQEYIKRLRKKMGNDCYIIAEKILEHNEDLTADWDIQGTSGYEFLSFSNRVLTDKQGAEELIQFYESFTGMKTSYTDLVFQNKYAFLCSQMQGEWNNLMDLMEQLDLISYRLTNRDRIKKALGIFMAAFPVYRIYPFAFPLAEEDVQLVDDALERAHQKDGELQNEFEFIRSLFYEDSEQVASRKMAFIMRLMQFTGPLAAKGVEDTAFYVYNPLISHNEVGDAPSELAITVDAFHKKMISRQKNNPYSLNSSSTHDTKRGEDARTRINTLSHLRQEWMMLVEQWQKNNQKFIQQVNGRNAPSLNDEYYMYQSLLGSFPENLEVDDVFVERTRQFIFKALREAKVETTYTKPNSAYENACVLFIASILREPLFLKTFIPFLEKVIRYASIYSLVQTAIKITAPGIPDIYQGCELWDLSYVDPDNRRAIDYDSRKKMLQEIRENKENLLSLVKKKRKSGGEKLFTTSALLHLRKEMPDVFIKGDYIPLSITGTQNTCLAYLRKKENQCVLVLLPLGFELKDNGDFQTSWENVFIELPEGLPLHWKNRWTGQKIVIHNTFSMSGIFDEFPLMVYVSEA